MASSTASDRHTTAARRLWSDGQRYTPGRRALVAVLDEAARPLTVEEILDADPGLAQSSTYRNLAVLERAGVVHRIVATDEFARYELDEDLTGHHHHLICTGCGSVSDFTVEAEVEQALGDSLAATARHHGFVTDHHRLDLVGRCAGCATASRGPTAEQGDR